MPNSETIHNHLEAIAKCYSERLALQMPSAGKLRTYTYGQLVAAFQIGADKLKQTGVQAGDRIVLISENSPEWVIAYLAILAAGATVAPMDPKLMPADLAELIETTEPSAILLSSQLLPQLVPEATLGLPVLNIEDNLTHAEGTLTQVSPQIPPTPDRDQAIASIFFTSGTNGKPKGVLLEHQTILHTAHYTQDLVGYQQGDPPHQILCVPPLYHIGGFQTLLGGLLMGATITFLEVVRGDKIIAAMRETGTTILPGVPRLLELFYSEIQRQIELKDPLGRAAFHGLGFLSDRIRTLTPWNPSKYLFKSVRQTLGGKLTICFCGAAPLSTEVERALERIGLTILKGYGLTETTGALSGNNLHQRRLGHMGQALDGVEIRIYQPSSSGEGEICVRGKSLMLGYFRNPEATQEVIRDGWFHTGDIGKLDTGGNLLVTGRIKELIVTPGGKKAAPTAVEAYYQGLPGVKELAVVGISTVGNAGDQIHSAVILDPESLPTGVSEKEALRAIERAINARASQVPAYLRIQGVHQVEKLPKTTTFKVKRTLLKQQIIDQINAAKKLPEDRDNLDIAVETIDDEVSQRVIAIVAEVVRNKNGRTSAVKIDSTLQFDLAIDSLGLVELAAKIERAFGVKLDQQIVPVFYTVCDLIEAVRTLIDPSNLSQEKSEKSSATASPLVALQPRGSKPILYCVHPLAGVVFPYYELARLLGKEQPVYALQAVGLNATQQPLTRIEEMAAHYLKALREVQPEGPYFLAGWSLGAFIAFEMAVQLQQTGQSVAMLALLDTPALANNKIANFLQMSQLVGPAVVGDIWPYIYEYFQLLSKEERLGNFQLTKIAQLLWDSKQLKEEQQAVISLLKVLWANSQAINYYSPQVYGGKVNLFLTDNHLHRRQNQDQTWGWKMLTTSQVKVHSIPGNHMNILRQPYVQTLALKLEQCLQQAEN